MAKGIVRVKAKAEGEITKVKMMLKHSMETGRRINKDTGEETPALFLQELKVMHDGTVVFAANMGTAVSKNPYFAFNFAGGAKGDELTMTWVENTGDTATETARIK